MIRKFSVSFTLFLAGSDSLLIAAGLALAQWLRITTGWGAPGPDEAFYTPPLLILAALVIWLSAFVWRGCYSPRKTSRLVDEVLMLMSANGVASLVFAGLLYLTYRDFSRLQFMLFALLIALLTLLHRIAVRTFFRLAGGRTYDSRRVLIVGTGETAKRVAGMIREYAWGGLYIVGFIVDETDPEEIIVGGAPILGNTSEIGAAVEKTGAQEIILALCEHSELDIILLVRELQERSVNIRIVPDYSSLVFLDTSVEDFGGMPLIGLREPAIDGLQRLFKRGFDMMLTLFLMPFALPIMGVIAIAIIIDSGLPIFFHQERVGEGRKLFRMHKFRTMIPGADKMIDKVIELDDKGNVIFNKKADDPRITRLGHFLRRTSLDELPQLFNVLKGEMSLVGPRPEMPWLVERYEPWQYKRFEVPQGMTGWWQVNGRSEKLMHLHTEEDLFYVRNYSLWLDIQILAKTFGAVLRRRGAY
jgi:exopolysaccharide biosynthesis polyprenyl glycosylphosphotransferase